MNQTQNSNHIDPFHKQSILSLNPRTFRDSKDAVKSNDLEAIHQYMNSMALQDPDKHFEEARSIVDSGSDFQNTKESEDDTKENEDPQKNRPALARRRAKFSLKPNTSQPTTIPEPTFQFDHLQDPEEFFAAYDKFENARKELKRLRGEDPNEAIIPATARQRRPEIPRRKASYQHHVYSSQPENDKSFAQETPQDNIGSPHTRYSLQESVTANCQSKENQMSASVTKTGDTDKLFHELMSSNIASLDENDAMSFLKDCLKIKPVVVDNLQLPDFHDIPRVDLPSSVNNLIKDQSILSDTCALSDSLRGKTLGKQKSLSENSFISLGSPTPPRSPFLAISALGKSLSKSVESNDPYSPRDIDLLPARTSEVIGGHSTHVSKDKGFPLSNTTDSLVKNKVTEAPVHDVLQKVSVEVPVISHDTDILSEPLISIEDRKRCHNMGDIGEGDVVAGPYVVSDIQTNEGLQPNAAEMVENATSATKLNLCVEDIGDNAQFHCVQDMDENVVSVYSALQQLFLIEVENVKENTGSSTAMEVNVEAPMVKEIQSHVQSGANSADDLDASRPAQNSEIVPRQHDEEQLRISMDTRKKSITKRKVDKKKRRQSLAEAGSTWTTGVRRSNRIRRKPLEYWKGERLLYGRVHNSLPTVIGVKYLDPTNKNGEPGFTVESFVSDEYKDLVELTALH